MFWRLVLGGMGSFKDIGRLRLYDFYMAHCALDLHLAMQNPPTAPTASGPGGVISGPQPQRGQVELIRFGSQP